MVEAACEKQGFGLGMVAVVQTFGDQLNPQPHAHTLVTAAFLMQHERSQTSQSPEATARETERIRSEAEARLNAKRQRAEGEAAQRSQAERGRVAADLEKMKTELERTRQEAETARKAAEAGRQQLEQQRQARASRVAGPASSSNRPRRR